MNKVGIIQARMGSIRLPGKVLKKIDGDPLLKIQIDRIKRANLIDHLIVATSKSKSDDPIADFCEQNKIEYFRGSENDVLSRYYECAKCYNADIIIRLCADNPLIDPQTIDNMIQFFLENNADYASNGVPPENTRFPDGSDLEVFSMKSLEKAHFEAEDSHDREHVTFYMWKYNNGFKTFQLSQKDDWSNYRYTMDYPEDFEVIEYVVRELNGRNSFGHLPEIVEIIESNSQIKKKNAHYYYGIGWEQGK
ncbi:glycosyltransferase family protein [Caldithrix abyssi]|nr:glycosyltransferase family protein [Caldithrix abyssi]